MKLQKAIEILSLTVAHSRADNTPDVRDAIKLGIEAMKRINHCRRWTSSTWGSPLPGETPEEEGE